MRHYLVVLTFWFTSQLRSPVRLLLIVASCAAPPFVVSVGMVLSSAVRALIMQIPENKYILLSAGSGVESRSSIPTNQIDSIIALLGARHEIRLEQAETSLVLNATGEVVEGGGSIQFIIRALRPNSSVAGGHTDLEVSTGSVPRAGSRELLVTPALDRWIRDQSAASGSLFIARKPWTIVGVGTFLRRAGALEAYTSQESLREMFHLNNDQSSVIVTMSPTVEPLAVSLLDGQKEGGVELVQWRSYIEGSVTTLRRSMVFLWVLSCSFVLLCAIAATYMLRHLVSLERVHIRRLLTGLGFDPWFSRLAEISEGAILGSLGGLFALGLATIYLDGRSMQAGLAIGGVELSLSLNYLASTTTILAGTLTGLIAYGLGSTS